MIYIFILLLYLKLNGNATWTNKNTAAYWKPCGRMPQRLCICVFILIFCGCCYSIKSKFPSILLICHLAGIWKESLNEKKTWVNRESDINYIIFAWGKHIFLIFVSLCAEAKSRTVKRIINDDTFIGCHLPITQTIPFTTHCLWQRSFLCSSLIRLTPVTLYIQALFINDILCVMCCFSAKTRWEREREKKHLPNSRKISNARFIS